MTATKFFLALDIGEKRIGVATAESMVRIPVVQPTMEMREEHFYDDVAALIAQYSVDLCVVGYPRNQAGEPTKQTIYIEKKAAELTTKGIEIAFQDESLTSVLAVERISARGDKPNKTNIDSEAARIILTDYLEAHYE